VAAPAAIEFASLLSLMAFVTVFGVGQGALLVLADVNCDAQPVSTVVLPRTARAAEDVQPRLRACYPRHRARSLAITPYIDRNPSHKQRPQVRHHDDVDVPDDVAVLVIIGCSSRAGFLHLPVGQARHFLRL
jgi:hypothetical protein